MFRVGLPADKNGALMAAYVDVPHGTYL